MSSDMERIISGVLYVSLGKEENEAKLEASLHNPENLMFFIKCADNFVFRKYAEKFNLPEEVIKMREALETEVINNYENHDVESVQEAVGDMLFHNNSSLAALRILTLKERAQNSPEFNKLYEPYAEFLDKAIEFFSLKKDTRKEQVGAFLEELAEYKSKLPEGEQIFDVVERLYREAEKGFVHELSVESRKCGDKIFQGIEPEEVELSSGEKVKVYKIQNQTENQRDFHLLTRCISLYDYMMQEGARERYSEEVSKFDYFSYSVFNENTSRRFVKRYVSFGFFDVPETEVLSSTVGDGQTNQFTIERGMTVYSQQLLPIDRFVEETASYNEVVLTEPERILPSVVIASDEIPTEEEIKVANAFNIPIIFLDKSCYEPKQTKPREVISSAKRDFSDYDKKRIWLEYQKLLPKELGKGDDSDEMD